MLRKRMLALVFAVILLGGLSGFLFAQNFMDTKPTMQFSIPKNYGLLVTIYQSGASTVMWFEAQDGTLRRVLLSSEGTFDLNVWAITRE
ncbi:hypothetical protein LLH00_00485 [bacterium]|nr:hypothetical protein [bacterium]